MKVTSRWPVVPLGEVVAETQYGTSTKANEEGLGAPILRMGNITYGGALDLTDLKHVEMPLEDVARYSVRRGDLLFNRTNSQELVGKMAVWDRDEPYVFAGYLVRLRLRTELAEPAFVAAWFNTPEMKTLLRTKAKPSINMSNINATEVLKFPIVRPPLAEQRRIADVLDRAEALRAKRRTAVGQIECLAQALFFDLFGSTVTDLARWPRRELQQSVREGTIITYGIVQAGVEFPGGTPYIRTGDIVDGQVLRSGLRHTDPKIAAKFQRSRVEAGDIVMSIRATVGTTAPIPVELDGANLTQGTARISPGACVDPTYLLSYLRSPEGQHWISRQVKGATFREITLTRLRELPVAVPPLALQQEFARRIAAVDKLKTAHRASLAQLDELFASLQHRAFRGEL